MNTKSCRKMLLNIYYSPQFSIVFANEFYGINTSILFM